MKADFVNPIYEATTDVLQSMLELDVKRGELKTSEELISGNEANVAIGVTGDLSGSILFSFSRDMALSMVESMAGMEVNELDKFVTSALGEVANIISGNAATFLNQQDYDCDIVPPRVIIGENQSLSMATDSVLVIPLKTDMGEFEINLAIWSNK
ncbi:chemotaxis protein CheX [Halarsenatibacter silvermanii]|nr:chemotaxis protein CheX [Halarsenatibacter silvermanii]